ncbi:MAG: helix-turn-helix domain-containing protein [Candidatus Binataceae bacterium]|jgi:predicted DNA-binding transcriptional regulator AlpA
MHDSLLSQTEAAKLLNLKPRTLERWRQKRQGPPWVSYSARCVRYQLSDLNAWLMTRKVRTNENAAQSVPFSGRRQQQQPLTTSEHSRVGTGDVP